MAPTPKLPMAARELIVQALAELATTYAAGPPALYYRDLVSRVELPEKWFRSIVGTWTGDADADGRKLILWAIARDVNPRDPRYTTLGSLLSVLLEDLGLKQQSDMVALIYAYRLYRDDDLLSGLASRYQIPRQVPALPVADDAYPAVPFELRELPGELELQGLFRREPDFLDVGFLGRAIERAASICRVETTDGRPLGTGFLVGQRTLLTNYHVVEHADGKDLEEKAGRLLLRFRSVTAADGKESEGLVFRPDPSRPLLRSSPVRALDYALIRVEREITGAADIQPVVPAGQQQVAKGMGLHILGHPQGVAMKLAISANGIVGVYRDAGLLQYATRALNGSSGSPCFDEAWQLVAIHHAERAATFGAVREGILIEPILDEIRSFI